MVLNQCLSQETVLIVGKNLGQPLGLSQPLLARFFSHHLDGEIVRKEAAQALVTTAHGNLTVIRHQVPDCLFQLLLRQCSQRMLHNDRFLCLYAQGHNEHGCQASASQKGPKHHVRTLLCDNHNQLSQGKSSQTSLVSRQHHQPHSNNSYQFSAHMSLVKKRCIPLSN